MQLATGAAPPQKGHPEGPMIVQLHHRFASNLVSIEEYLSGVSAHSRRNETVPNVLTHVAGAAQSRLSYLLCL